MYRKNTTSILKEWKNYIGKNLINENSERDRAQSFEALIADLIDCNFGDDKRIDTLIDVLRRCNMSDDELKAIAYSSEAMSDEAEEWRQNRLRDEEPLEDDEDFNDDDAFDERFGLPDDDADTYDGEGPY